MHIWEPRLLLRRKRLVNSAEGLNLTKFVTLLVALFLLLCYLREFSSRLRNQRRVTRVLHVTVIILSFLHWQNTWVLRMRWGDRLLNLVALEIRVVPWWVLERTVLVCGQCVICRCLLWLMRLRQLLLLPCHRISQCGHLHHQAFNLGFQSLDLLLLSDEELQRPRRCVDLFKAWETTLYHILLVLQLVLNRSGPRGVRLSLHQLMNLFLIMVLKEVLQILFAESH